MYDLHDGLDIVFIEMKNATLAKYNYHYFDHSELHFMASVNNTGYPNRSNILDYYLMDIKGELGKARQQNLTFAIEVYPNEKSYNTTKDYYEFCLENTEPHLRPLIKSCFNRIILRNLTEDEAKETKKSRAGKFFFV